MAPLNTSADSPTVSNHSLRDVVALHTCRVPVRYDDIDDVSWWCMRLQLTDSGPQYVYIVRVVIVVLVVVLVVVDDVLLRCVPMVMATMSTIDDYGFSFNYVGRGNTTDNTYPSLYDFFINWYVIYTYTRIYI